MAPVNETKTKTFRALDPEFNRILQILANAKFSVGDTGMNSRMMNYYEEKGLLYSTRETSLGWRRFDAYELVWLSILDHLRMFGYPLEKAKKIKDDFSLDHSGKVDERGNYETRGFEWFIALSVATESQFYFIVSGDGKATFYDHSNSDVWNLENSWMEKPHISIPLTPIIRTIWDSITDEKPVSFKKSDMVTVNKSEKELLEEIRGGKYERVEIKFKNKKPQLFKGTERILESKKIEEILHENLYQEINLKRKDGKVVSIIRQITKKL